MTTCVMVYAGDKPVELVVGRQVRHLAPGRSAACDAPPAREGKQQVIVITSISVSPERMEAMLADATSRVPTGEGQSGGG